MAYLDETGLSHLWDKIIALESGSSSSSSVTTLYDNESGSVSITLSETSANYKFLVVCGQGYEYEYSPESATTAHVVNYYIAVLRTPNYISVLPCYAYNLSRLYASTSGSVITVKYRNGNGFYDSNDYNGGKITKVYGIK